MSEYVGAFQHQPGPGYELFFTGMPVHGADAYFYSMRQAVANCRWNKKLNPQYNVVCHYDGKIFY
jgi:hypothetical protein